MTWSHPRGYDPLVACAALWEQQTGISVAWDKRSLQDFESYPVEELARAYDLIVIDHPHVGQITAEDCLVALDRTGNERARAAIAVGSLGGSYESYAYAGHQWAFPIDAAAQVQAWRPDLLDRPASHWLDVVALARDGRVLLPLRPPHALMAFFTLAANLGTPCTADRPDDLIAADAGAAAYALLAELAAMVPADCLRMDPIAVSERVAEAGSTIACAPLIYGYVSYAREGFRHHRLAFADIPSAGGHGPVGSALGGTGVAVSAFSRNRDAAVAFAEWVASATVQRGVYAQAGGQPGHAAAWGDDAVNAATHDFYRATRRTLDGAWVRPRHNGYMGFQQAGSELLVEALAARRPPASVVDDLNRLFRLSFAG